MLPKLATLGDRELEELYDQLRCMRTTVRWLGEYALAYRLESVAATVCGVICAREQAALDAESCQLRLEVGGAGAYDRD